jgi:hypothetical protein
MKKMKQIMALATVAAMMVGMFAMTASASDDNNTGNQEDPAVVSTDPTGGGEDSGGTGSGTGSGSGSNAGSTYAVTQNTISNVNNPITGITVTKAVTAKAGVTLPNEKFYIQMAPAEVAEGTKAGATVGDDGTTSGGITVEAGPALATSVLEFDFGASNKTQTGKTSSSADFNITSFADGGFNHAGVYRYNITEVSKNDDGTYSALTAPEEGKTYYVEYDYTTYQVDLYVSADNTSNKYVVTSVAVSEVGKTEKPTSITFTNQINCANITITKAIDGDAYTNGESFDFYILIPKGGDTITLTANDTIQAQKYDAEGKASGDPFTLKVDGDTINEAAATYGTKFSLKDGESLQITAPVSMIYKVVEADYSDEGYTTTVDYESEGQFGQGNEADGKLLTETVDGKTYTGIRGTTETTVNSVLFKNSRNDAAPSTGVNTDFVPYVLVLLVALAGGALLAFKKRAIR